MMSEQQQQQAPGAGDGEEQSGVQPPVDTPELRKAIKDAGKTIADLRAERTELNASIQEALEGLKAKGISKTALKRAIDDAAMDEDARHAQDVAFIIARAALGKPTQAELFPATETQH